jgi:DNA (cytosine-5)-methyltransferase 1
MNAIINYIDLFSGFGGFAKGFLDAEFTFRNHYYSEIDENAKANYRYQFPKAIDIGPVEFVRPSFFKDHINLITYGFPCQDLSVAGKQVGLDGCRSGLFFQAVQLIKALAPDIFIFENVKGLLSSSDGKDFERCLREIANLGIYECEWQLVNTLWLLPQNRERVFFIGHASGRSRPKVFPITEDEAEFARPQKEAQGARPRLRGNLSR